MPNPAPTPFFPPPDDPFFAQDLAQMARARNYQRWQFDLIKPFLHGDVLEIGSGIGNFTPLLAAISKSVVAVEPNPYCYQNLLQKVSSLANVSTFPCTTENLLDQIVPGYLADTIVCMNVLEHLADDSLALQTFSTLLKPGGQVVLLVPALPWLFGELDRRVGHYRRYTYSSLAKRLTEASLSMVEIRYFNFIGLWGWWWNARIAGRQAQSDFQIHIFDKFIVPWQSRLENVIRPPLGQSLIAVARKPL